MKITIIKWLVITLGIASFFGSMAFYFYLYGIPGGRINDPGDFYRQGELASTPERRKIEFNKALGMYLELEKQYDPQYGNGKLYYNIGNTYHQLSEYPAALLYLYKAARLRPRDSRVNDSINASLQKLNLPSNGENVSFYTFSLPERLQYFSIAFMIFFLICSVYIWTQKKWLKSILYLSLLVCIMIGATFLYSLFFTPVYGVIMKGSSLYKHPGKQYAKVTENPISAGLKVRIITMTPDKKWVKIVTSDNTMGFVTGESLRII